MASRRVKHSVKHTQNQQNSVGIASPVPTTPPCPMPWTPRPHLFIPQWCRDTDLWLAWGHTAGRQAGNGARRRIYFPLACSPFGIPFGKPACLGRGI